jgi:dipeptidyl-peptidase-3
LGNVIAAIPSTKTTFLSDEDEKLYKKYNTESFELQVGLHELLGHGSGKLFIRNKDGTYNFDVDKVKDLESGEKITSWYEEGELYSMKFGAMSSAYEECRAEAVGYYLCTFPEVTRVFGYSDEKVADDIKYVNLLTELRAGLVALEYYSPERKTWGQAHCHARFVLLMVGLEAGEGFLQIKEFKNEQDGKPDLLFTLDRSKIESVGKPAIGKFLKKLQLFKCTGDIAKARAMFIDHYSKMTPEILHWRDIVVARRKPRRILVLANSVLKDNKVSLVTYPETPEGAVQSNIERYLDSGIEGEILDLWKKDQAFFK